MKPGERLTAAYNIDIITGEALREKEARDSITSLEELFNDQSEQIYISKDFIHLDNRIRDIFGDANLLLEHTRAYKSTAYDQFQRAGINLETHIIKFGFKKIHSISETATVYMLAITGDEQLEINANNCRYGAALLSNGELKFFEYRAKTEEENVTAEHLAVPIPPEDEIAVVNEFKRAHRLLTEPE
jgi:hypothetical protein